MGLFGSRSAKKKTPFEEAFGAPDDGMWGRMPQDEAIAPRPQLSPFADQNMMGRDWLGMGLGTIGDAISTANGGQAWAMPMAFDGIQRARDAQAAQAARQTQLEDEQRKRGEGWDDFVKKEEWGRAHPEASKPTSDIQNFEYLQKLDPAGQAAWSQANPTVYMTPDGPQLFQKGPGTIGHKIRFADMPGAPANNTPSGNPLQAPAAPMDPIMRSFIKTFGEQEGMARWKQFNEGGR
jgi:hypothetical protein